MHNESKKQKWKSGRRLVMTNLEKMKDDIIQQIKNMSSEQYHEFLATISEHYNPETNESGIEIDLSAQFLCPDCATKYGDEDDECGSKGLCVVRFIDYAEQEVKNNGKEII